MSTPDQYGLEQNKDVSVFAVTCTSPECQMSPEALANADRPYFTDTLTSRTYCYQCGCRLRYHRKKSAERGKDIPLSLEEVARNMATHRSR